MATDQTSTRLHLGRPDDGRELSPEEFAEATYDEPWTYERVGGRLVVVSPDSEAHDDTSEPIRDHLGAYRLSHPEIIEKVVGEAWVRIDPLLDRVGDLGVYLRRADGTTPPARPGRMPELMFEFVSDGARNRRRDYVEKRADYESAGIREYVVVDRFTLTFTVHNLGPGGYDERILTSRDTYETPLLPGFRFPLGEIF